MCVTVLLQVIWQWYDAMAWIWELTNESRGWWCNHSLVNLNLYGEWRVSSYVYTCIPLSLPIHQHPCIQQRLLGFAAQSTDRLGPRGLHWRYIHWNGELCEPLFNRSVIYGHVSTLCVLHMQREHTIGLWPALHAYYMHNVYIWVCTPARNMWTIAYLWL